MAVRPAIAALLVAALLAGCSDPPADPGAGTGAVLDGSEECGADAAGDCMAQPLTADSSVPAPTWARGQWWEWEVSFGTETRDETFRSIVLDADGAGYVLATERDGMAKEEAAFDHPFLGAIGRDLAMSGFGGSWQLLEFPLTHGKTWTATIPNVAWDIVPSDAVDLDMSATFDADLQGFRLMGHVGDDMLLEGTYLPATGWFGELLLNDVDPGQEELEVGLRAVSAGGNYTGPVFTATSEPRLVLVDGSGFTDFPTEGGEPFLEGPQPHGTFTLGSGTLLFGVLVAEAVIGTRIITITDPTNAQRQVVASGAPEGGQELWLDEPGVAGQWTVATSGAGGLSLAIVELYELTLTETAL